DRSIFFKQGNDNNERALTQYSKETDAKAAEVKGNSAGSINSFNISQNGEVNAVYTNGESNTLATIALATFDNPAGLQKEGGNLFKDTVNSGTPKLGQPSTGSFGSLNPGALEMSNVDLSKEFTKMITTQRGFQANSRVISTSDEILQELVNLKR
ncbi:MAG: flagellar hook-basal body complex protein, partial [Bacillota bacterium]